MTEQSKLEALADRHTLKRRIEQMDVPADVKALLAKLMDTTVEVGGKLVQVGRRILAWMFDLARNYPNIAFCTLVALVLSFLISSIPGLGPLLSPILTPVLLIVGLSMGALQDFVDRPMRERLSGMERQIKDLGVA